ncbi:hypothetical protein CPB97_007464 [Podila verticillata]|nr:hypothetical protein CPB97_007464 [Podila verticillata]
MEQLDNTLEVFLLQHPLAHAKDPPVAIPTLPRHRQTNPQVPPTPTSLPYSLSPPGSPVLASTHSPLRRSGTPTSTTPVGATGITSKSLHSTVGGASGGAGLARDLTTRLWQREAELQTMKDLYDAKIKRLTEMLQDAGVSPTEVENNLAVVVEETVIADDGNDIMDHPFTLQQRHHHQPEAQRPLFDHISVRSGRSGIRSEQLFNDDNEDQTGLVEDETEDQSESMSSSGSILSSCPTQFTRPDHLTGRKSDASVEVIGTRARGGGRVDDISVSGRPSMESTSAASTTSTKHYPSERPFSPTSLASVDSRYTLDPPSSTTTTTTSISTTTTTTTTSSGVKAHSREGQSQPQGSQSPIPSFISESFAAGTLGMKTLREKWVIASGVLPWSKHRSDSRPSHQQHNSISSCSSIVTSPSGLFISRDGIVNDKKPAVVEASIPPPLHHDNDLTSLSGRDPWSSVILPSSRKLSAKATRHLATRPMSEYPELSLAQDISRPPISSIQSYLRKPEPFNPSPLHFRAISMAANLIDTGAITPAKLYARRTQTMIAKWTMGLIMNSKRPRSSSSVFPVIRESHPSEGMSERQGSDDSAIKDNTATADSESVSNYGRYSASSISPTDIPRALSSFRSHASATNLMSSSYSSHYSSHHSQHPSYSHHSQHLSIMNPQSIVELSDISSPPLSMSPSSTYVGECKPLTDRYGFIVNARPMAVQQGLLKLNEVYGNDDMDSSHLQRAGTFEYLQTSSDESERSLSSPTTSRPESISGPSPSAFYSGYAQSSMTTSPPTSSLPMSVTSPILSTATRPTSTLSPPSSSSATVTTLLSQIKVMHDSVQLTQKEKWDAFLRKRKRRVHLGEANGNMSSTNLGSPLFGSLSLAAAAGVTEEGQDDDDVLYWTSVCIIGIATIGKGSEWEEFRDLVRGGIPVMYRNKIWQEASGAYDMRQPGYYKELLSKQNIEECQCWGDIEMDLHRTFPTNILFGPGGHGIDKLKNILIAYSLYNPVVGYCQGMNLLAGTLLLTNNSEEEAFWILVSMLGRHLPEDYFTQQLLSPQADQRVLKELVQEILPRLHEHFQEMHVDLTAVTFSWFLTLFTDCLPVETLLRVWDVFFVEGMLVLFKVAVAVLWMNEKDILRCRNGAAVYCFMKQMTLSMNQGDKLMKIEAKRQRHQRSVRQELLQEQQMMKMRTFACASPPPRQQT